MNRLLQHFVDSNGAPDVSASRPPIPAPPQSSGGSYHGVSRGSYQRAAPGGPFYYQAPQWQSPSGLEEIPLTSQSSGGMYETVDLNADTSQKQYRKPLFTPNRESSFRQQKAPGSTGSAAELFASGPPPDNDLFSSGGNPYRRLSEPVATTSIANGHGGNKTTSTFSTSGGNSMPKDPFASSSDKGGTSGHTSSMTDPFATQKEQHDPFKTSTEENRRKVADNDTNDGGKDPFVAQTMKESGHQDDRSIQQQSTSDRTPGPMTDGHEQMPSADSLFGSPAPSNNGNWTQSPSFPHSTQSALNPVQAQDLFASEAPSASNLFSASASTRLQISRSTSQTSTSSLPPKTPVSIPPSPVNSMSPSAVKCPIGIPPSPSKSKTIALPSPMKPPVAVSPTLLNNVSSPSTRLQVVTSTSPSPAMRPEDHLSSAFGSSKLTTPAKSPLKSGLDIRHMKLPSGKREEDAMSNTPSIAPSRMSMLSTLDDSLKLSDMYKQMAARLEGEKHDLLKVVAGQAQEITHMKKHIKSLELQLKKYQTQDA